MYTRSTSACWSRKTAAWLEFRGGKPHEILQVMTEAASQQVEEGVGLA